MNRHLRGILACGVSLFLLAGCAPAMLSLVTQPSQEPSTRETPAVSAEALHGSGTIFLLPMGNFPISVVEDLVKYYRGKFGLIVHPLPSIPIPSRAMNRARNQLIAEDLLDIMDTEAPQLPGGAAAAKTNSILIGLTTGDMYTREKRDWTYIFAQNVDNDAVVSTGRMDPTNSGEPSNPTLANLRLRKMVTKEIGVLYYHLPTSRDHQSAVFGPVYSLGDLDAMTEDY